MADGQHSKLPSAGLDTREANLFRALCSSDIALRLAKAYIKCKNEEPQASGSKFDADDYLQEYNRRSSSTGRSPSELSAIGIAVATTMSELMRQDEELGVEIAKFLLVTALFAPGDIPLGMVSSVANNKQELELILQTLEKYSLVKWNKDAGVLTFDDLIRQSNIQELSDGEYVMRHALRVVLDTDSTTIHHALEVWNRAARSERYLEELEEASCHIVVRYLDLGDYDAALSFGRKALEVVKTALEPDHPGLLRVLNLVLTIPSLREMTKGKLGVIDSLKRSERLKPQCIADNLNLQRLMAFQMESDTKRALEVMKEVHEKTLVRLGPNHREILLTKGHIARLEYQLNKRKCNESYKVLAEVVEALGEGREFDYEEIAFIRLCLVELLESRGELDEALARLRVYSDACNRPPLPIYDVTLKFLERLGGILVRKNDFRGALNVFKELHKLQEKKFGHNDHQARRTLSWIKQTEEERDNSNGCQFMREVFLLGTFHEATKLLRQDRPYEVGNLLDVIARSELPASSSMHLIAILLRAKLKARTDSIGRFVLFWKPNLDESTLYDDYTRSLMEHYGRDQVKLFRRRYARALELFAGDKYEESYQAFVSSLMKEPRSSTFDDAPKLKEQFDRAKTLRHKKMLEESLRIFEQVFERQMESLGPDDLVTLDTEYEMADVLHKLHRHGEAIRHFRHVYKKRMQLLGPENTETVNAHFNLARSKSAQDYYQEALDIFRSVFDRNVAKLGPSHPNTLATRYYIAYCLYRQGDHIDSYCLFKKVYSAQRRVLGPCHPDTLVTKTGLEMSENRLKRDPECRQGINRVVNDHATSKTRDLHRKINDGDVKDVLNLLRESVDVTQVATDQGWTPLHTATLKGNLQMVEVLVSHAVWLLAWDEFDDLVNARTTSGQNTALHLAAEGGHLEIVLFLLQHRAIYELRNEQGKKPVDVAATNKIGELLRLIDEIFKSTQRGERGVFDVVDGLNVDKIEAVFNTRNTENQPLAVVAGSNEQTHFAGRLMKCFEEKVSR